MGRRVATASRVVTRHSGGGDDLDPVSSVAIAGAEAVVYVFTQGVRADDQAILSAFAAATASRDAGPVNALAVLNKADTIPPESVEGSGGDPVLAARIVAANQASVLRPRVADVLPVIGLLGETVETGAFTARDADALRALATVDEAMFGAMMMAADLCTTLDAPIDAEQRLRLLELLDLYGIRHAVDLLRTDPTMGASELRRRLLGSLGRGEPAGPARAGLRLPRRWHQGLRRACLAGGPGRGLARLGGTPAHPRRDRGVAPAAGGAPIPDAGGADRAVERQRAAPARSDRRGAPARGIVSSGRTARPSRGPASGTRRRRSGAGETSGAATPPTVGRLPRAGSRTSSTGPTSCSGRSCAVPHRRPRARPTLARRPAHHPASPVRRCRPAPRVSGSRHRPAPSDTPAQQPPPGYGPPPSHGPPPGYGSPPGYGPPPAGPSPPGPSPAGPPPGWRR